MTKLQKEQIHHLRQKLTPYSQIAGLLGLSMNTVKSYCYRHGLNTETLNSINGYCQQCGKPLISAKTKPRRFCSTACKTAFWNGHRRERASNQITMHACLVCGENFSDYHSVGRKYCSQACYQKRGQAV